MFKKGILNELLAGMPTGATTGENSWKFLKKLKMELSYDPAIPLLGIYPKKSKTVIWKNMHPYVHRSIIYNNQVLETT